MEATFWLGREQEVEMELEAVGGRHGLAWGVKGGKGSEG